MREKRFMFPGYTARIVDPGDVIGNKVLTCFTVPRLMDKH